MEKIKLRQAIVVEGRYDAAKIGNIADAMILITDGFAIFSDEAKQKLFKSIAKQRGLVLLTDSDSAGFKIRHFITGLVGKDRVVQAYTPDIAGKEKRKAAPSKEGLLGVEGVSDEVLRKVLKECCSKEAGDTETFDNGFSNYDFYCWGITGAPGAAEKKRKLLKQLGLPERINKNTLLQLFNTSFRIEEIEEALQTLHFI